MAVASSDLARPKVLSFALMVLVLIGAGWIIGQSVARLSSDDCVTVTRQTGDTRQTTQTCT